MIPIKSPVCWSIQDSLKQLLGSLWGFDCFAVFFFDLENCPDWPSLSHLVFATSFRLAVLFCCRRVTWVLYHPEPIIRLSLLCSHNSIFLQNIRGGKIEWKLFPLKILKLVFLKTSLSGLKGHDFCLYGEHTPLFYYYIHILEIFDEHIFMITPKNNHHHLPGQ